VDERTCLFLLFRQSFQPKDKQHSFSYTGMVLSGLSCGGFGGAGYVLDDSVDIAAGQWALKLQSFPMIRGFVCNNESSIGIGRGPEVEGKKYWF
jgi:hypothetical protein